MDFTRLNNGSQPSLNLSKGNVLDLTKQAPALKNCVLGGGWDMAVAGPTADLDLAAFLIEDSGRVTQVPQDVIFFNNMSAPGIRLEGDNRTGEGDGGGTDERLLSACDGVGGEISERVETKYCRLGSGLWQGNDDKKQSLAEYDVEW